MEYFVLVDKLFIETIYQLDLTYALHSGAAINDVLLTVDKLV